MIGADLHNHYTTSWEDLESLVDGGVEQARQTMGPGNIHAIVNAQDEYEGRYETGVEGLKEKYGDNLRDIGNAVYIKEKDSYVIKGQEVFTGVKEEYIG